MVIKEHYVLDPGRSLMMPAYASMSNYSFSQKVASPSCRTSLTREPCNRSKNLLWNRRSTLGLALGLLTASKPCTASEPLEAAKNIELGSVEG